MPNRTIKKQHLTVSGQLIPKAIFKKYYANDMFNSNPARDEKAKVASRKMGTFFTNARVAKGLTLEELANQAKLPVLVLEDLEAGHTLIAVHLYPYLAQFLDVTIMQAFEYAGLNGGHLLS